MSSLALRRKRTSEDENIKYLTNSFERLKGMLKSVTLYLFELLLILDRVLLDSYAFDFVEIRYELNAIVDC